MVYESDNHTERWPGSNCPAGVTEESAAEPATTIHRGPLTSGKNAIKVVRPSERAGDEETWRAGRTGAGLSVELGGDDTRPAGITRRQHGAGSGPPLNAKETTGSN